MLRLILLIVLRRLRGSYLRALMLSAVVLICTVGMLAVWRTGVSARDAVGDAEAALAGGQGVRIQINPQLLDGGAIVAGLQRRFSLEPIEQSGTTGTFVVRGEAQALTALRQSLAASSPGISVQPPRLSNSEIAGLTAAFRTNLALLIIVALGVAALLAFHAAELSLITLRPELRTLDLLGCPAALMRWAVFLEIGLPACVGALVGATVGEPLVLGVAEVIQEATATLYTGEATLTVLSLTERLVSGALASALAVGIVLLGAWWAFKRHDPQPRTRGPQRLRASVALSFGGVLLAGGGLIAAQALNAVFLAYGAVLVLLIVVVLLAMVLLDWATEKKQWWPKSTSIFLGVRELAAGRANTRLAAGLLAAAVTLVLALGTMIYSFRGALVRWIDDTVQADLFVRTTNGGNLFRPSYLPDDVVRAVRAAPEVSQVVSFSAVGAVINNEVTIIAGTDALDPVGRTLVQGTFDSARFLAGQGVMLSTPALLRLGVQVGDAVAINGRSFAVLGAYEDFTSERGIVLMPLAVFQSLMGVREIVSLTITLRQGLAIEAVRAKWLEAEWASDLMIRSNHELRNLIVTIFDRTFIAARSMLVVIALMCWFGFVSTMVQSVSARRQEFRLLHALGADVRLLSSTLLVEVTVITIVGLLVGALGGGALAWCLVTVVNPLSFGWGFPLLVDTTLVWWTVFTLGAVGVVVHAVAGALVQRFVGSESSSRVG